MQKNVNKTTKIEITEMSLGTLVLSFFENKVRISGAVLEFIKKPKQKTSFKLKTLAGKQINLIQRRV